MPNIGLDAPLISGRNGVSIMTALRAKSGAHQQSKLELTTCKLDFLPASRPKTCPMDLISAASPATVPVPCASTYSVCVGSRPAVAYTEVANEACASALGSVMPAVLPS